MITFKTEGLDELIGALGQLPNRVSRRVQSDALLETGEQLRALVAAHMPRHAGAPDVADNVFIRPTRQRVDVDSNDVTVGIGVPRKFFYDYFLEFGTVHMREQPAYRPAFDDRAEPMVVDVGEILWREVAGKGVSRSSSLDVAVSGLGSSLL